MFKRLTNKSNVEGSGEVVDYEFECINPSEYFYLLKMKTQRGVLNFIFEKAKKKMKRKGGGELVGSPDEIESFCVPPEYMKLLTTTARRLMSKVEAEVKADGVKCLNSKVISADFNRIEKGVWGITIKIGGDYVKE